MDCYVIWVEDVWGVMLGYGMMVRCGEDIRGYEFWGDWVCVSKELVRFGVLCGGIVVGVGVEWDEVIGFVIVLK